MPCGALLSLLAGDPGPDSRRMFYKLSRSFRPWQLQHQSVLSFQFDKDLRTVVNSSLIKVGEPFFWNPL
jgi:hypothetical protein